MLAADWNVRLTRAREAIKSAENKIGGSIDWGDIKIGHIDTGYTKAKVFGNWKTRKVSLLHRLGENFVEKDKTNPLDPLDYGGPSEGHGTRIGGVITGSWSGRYKARSYSNIIGVVPGVPVVPYRAVNSVVLFSKRSVTDVANAIKHAVKTSQCSVINISLGFPLMGHRALGKAVDLAYEKGVIVVAAAGQYVDRVLYPAKYSRTIGVGGVTQSGRIYQPYDNEKPIDIWAPADPILRVSPKPHSPPTTPIGTSLELGDGTSYSAAHVSAAAALWLAAHGTDIDDMYGEPWQKIEAFRLLIKSTVNPLKGNAGLKSKPTGNTRKPKSRNTGVINLDKLIKAPLPTLNQLKKNNHKAADQWA